MPNDLYKLQKCKNCLFRYKESSFCKKNREYIKNFNLNNNSFKIMEEECYNNTQKLKCKCNKGHIFYKDLAHIKRDQECPYCTARSKILQIGINTFGDKRPELLKYLKNPEEGFKNIANSKNKVITKCNLCGYEKETSYSYLYNNGYICQACGKSISIPNRFIRNIILYKKDILNEYEFEYSPKWENTKYRYDVYFEYQNKKYIIEMQGLQHKTNTWQGKNIKNQQENDKNKKELALRNGVDYYIEVESYNTSIIYLNNKIKEINEINFLWLNEEELRVIQKNMNDSILEKVIEKYNQKLNVKQIAKDLEINICTVDRKLNKAIELGLTQRRKEDYGNIKVKVTTYINNDIYFFDSINEAIDFVQSEGFNASKSTLFRKIKKYKEYEYFKFELLNESSTTIIKNNKNKK